jgi:hypothetical protein
MFRTKRNIILVLAVCALLLPIAIAASANKPVERLFSIRGNSWVAMEVSNGNFVGGCSGKGTDIGWFTDVGHGNLYEGTGGGTLTAENGDQLFWNLAAAGGVWTVTYTGGTGRFEGATGSWVMVAGPQVSNPLPWDSGTNTITWTWVGSGKLTY